MTREDALGDLGDRPSERAGVNGLVNDIYNSFEYRTCENCKFLDVGPYDICPIVEPLSRPYLNYGESTFSCNRWEPKDE